MSEVIIGTKITSGGQTTIPQAIRELLGVKANDRVYWSFDGEKAYVSAEPVVPLSVTSARDFWDRISAAEEDIDAGRVKDAKSLSKRLRKN